MDTCWAVSVGFRATQPTYVGGFTARLVRLALKAGDAALVSQGLSMLATEMVVLRSSSRFVRRRAYTMIEQAKEIAEEVGEPRPIALNQHAAGLVAFYLARWQESLEHNQAAIEQLRSRCAGATHDIVNAEMHVISSLFYLGRVKELSRHVPGLLQEARARGDIFASILYASGYGFMAWLAEDDVATTRRELKLAHQEWPVEGFLFQNYMLLLAAQLTDLYCGEGQRAWERLGPQWRVIKRSPYFFMPMQRNKWFHIRGATAVAAARGSEANGVAIARLLKDAEQCGKRLVRDAFNTAPPHGQLVLAGVATTRGDSRAAVKLLSEAERRFGDLQMSLHAAIARRCRGVVLGGDEGRDLVRSADEVMTAEKIQRPDRMADMLCPGFPDGASGS